jgi:hypothetical protein
MAKVLRRIGHWQLTHAELRSGGKLVDEKYTITHPTRRPEHFDTRKRAEVRFAELVADE